MSRPTAALLVALFVLSFASLPASAQPAPSSVTMQVYGDGTVAVAQVVSADANATSVGLQLLSPIIADPVVFDQNGSGLYFQIAGANITVYTIGATGFTLEYATAALTSKQGAVWSLDFTAYYNSTVVLPQQSTLTSVSGTPISLSTSNGSPVVVVPPGAWEIDYGLPVSIVTTSTVSTVSSSTLPSGSTAPSGTSSTASSSTSSGLPPLSSTPGSSSTNESGSSSPARAAGNTAYLGAAAVVALAALAAALLFLRRKRGFRLDPQTSELRPDDIKVIEFISEKGGKVLEPEIRTRFALPKTSAWRQIKRLERLGYVKVTKIGSQNQVELIKNRQGAQ